MLCYKINELWFSGRPHLSASHWNTRNSTSQLTSRQHSIHTQTTSRQPSLWLILMVIIQANICSKDRVCVCVYAFSFVHVTFCMAITELFNANFSDATIWPEDSFTVNQFRHESRDCLVSYLPTLIPTPAIPLSLLFPPRHSPFCRKPNSCIALGAGGRK